MKKGIFIVFEGIDGSGKTTQALKFAEYLFSKNKYGHVLITREPYNNEKIREILSSEENPYSKAEFLSKLFVEDRKKHLEEVILPALDKGINVVCDRYKLSTLAYQWAQGVSLDYLVNMHEGFLVPDLTFLVDVPSYIALKRIKKDKKRDKEKKFEGEKKFIERVRRNYLYLVNLNKEKNFIIDGTKSVDEVFKSIVSIYESLF